MKRKCTGSVLVLSLHTLTMYVEIVQYVDGEIEKNENTIIFRSFFSVEKNDQRHQTSQSYYHNKIILVHNIKNIILE